MTIPIGVFILEEMAERQWTFDQFAEQMGLQSDRYSARLLITGEVVVDEPMAARLAKAFDTSAALWLRLARGGQRHALQSQSDTGAPAGPKESELLTLCQSLLTWSCLAMGRWNNPKAIVHACADVRKAVALLKAAGVDAKIRMTAVDDAEAEARATIRKMLGEPVEPSGNPG